ncbi:hypothetical protein OESDEN_15852 [Oesophagostomum dentatum]|uniref:Uncharacterized protein n=1 Tax=Oesophagostomum dentatum TaxID=61180 RepID=A0A0B1SHM7_OESDE|nr:hypothetical protein OESDEN_15852 [Oesophagostomum dentatum]
MPAVLLMQTPNSLEAAETKERVERAKPAAAQKKFMSGGFDSGGSSGFGSFGGGHFEKENTFGSSSSAGGRRGSFDGDRSSFGGGRSGPRGGNRGGGRGYERDRDPPRDDYRDRDRRERHDSFRGRSAGYGRSDSRDSQSFEGRGGYRSNRT